MVKTLTLNDWDEVFDSISLGNLPNWLLKVDLDVMLEVDQTRLNQPSQSQDLSLKTLGILLPTKGDALDFDFHPSLSFDSTDSSILGKLPEGEPNWRETVIPEEVLKYIDSINKCETNEGGMVKTIL
jgi:hypothetical protein